MRHLLLTIATLAVSTVAFTQSNQSHSQSLRALLEEVRLLRQDLHTTTVTAQRVQIALYRLQLQDAAVARASSVVEEAHAKVTELAAARKHYVTKKWDAWIGDWALSGTAKDTSTGPEYKVDWYLHEHWILNGFFVQVDQTWKGNGKEIHSLEILSYDPVKKIHTSSGFSSDGSTWVLTATFDDVTTIEVGKAEGPDG
jgi:hypothetical protein